MARKEEFSVGDMTIERTMAVNGETDLNGTVNINSVLDMGMGDVKMPVTAGEAISAGSLVCVGGWDATNGRLEVIKADADATTKGQRVAQFVANAAIASGAGGFVFGAGTLGAQNTDSATAVGDPVYLSDATAGAWTLTPPGTAGDIIQQVGVVSVKSATVGEVKLFPLYSKPVTFVS